MKSIIAKVIYLLMVITALLGVLNSPSALVAGIIFSLIFQNPFKSFSQTAISYLLKTSIVGLGFGMLFKETLETSKEGFSLTVCTILLTVILGFILIRVMKLEKQLGHLITAGTSICGGSAIAAISSVIRAKGPTISIALGIVFLLNSIALFVFPIIGHLLDLSQYEFGLWCAVAIHDTSSVVGSAVDYGNEALRIATTVKLSRTLWIIPLSIFYTFIFKTKGKKLKIPYFIFLFIVAIALNSYHIIPEPVSSNIVFLSKRLLILTLFVVGSTLSISNIKSIGIKPLLFALILWLFITIFSLAYILY